MKADPVSRQLVLDILAAFDLSERFRKWIEIYLNTPKFSISINGALDGYFHGDKGLRQGISFLLGLFILVIEFLLRILHFHISAKCQDLGIIHLFC